MQPGVLYVTSLESTLSNKTKAKIFFNIEEMPHGVIFWNSKTIEKLGVEHLKLMRLFKM